MTWTTIDETPARSDPVVVLRGVLATVPQSYERFYGRRRAPTLGVVAIFLWRVISWCIAGTAHLLVAAVLMSFILQARPEEEGLVWARLWRGDAGEQGKAVDIPKPAETAPELPPAEPVSPESEPAKPAPIPKPVIEKVEAKAPTPAETVVGAGATARVSDAEVERDPTAAIQRRRAGELGKLRGGTERQIVVVTGCYDKVEQVLERLRIPYTAVSPEKLPKHDLKGCLALLVNCHNTYATYAMKPLDTKALERDIVTLEERQKQLRKRLEATRDQRVAQVAGLELLQVSSELGELRRQLESVQGSGKSVEKIAEFVRQGGYLFTSDWGLSLVEQALPGYVRNGGPVGPRAVNIRPKAGGERHPLLEEVFYEGARAGGPVAARKFRWEIDGSSYLIRVDKPQAVETLVESGELGRHPAVAVVFSPEKSAQAPRPGKVLHVLSHFKKQATQQGDYALQNMLVNFLLDRAGPRKAEEIVAARPPAPEVYEDAKRGLSLPVPPGWAVREGGAGGVWVEMSREGDPDARFTLERVPLPAGFQAESTASWDAWLRGVQTDLEGRGARDVTVTRRLQAFCCGHPAVQVTRTYTREGSPSAAAPIGGAKEGAKRGELRYAVATPQGIVVLAWTGDAAAIKAEEAALERACRGLVVPRN